MTTEEQSRFEVLLENIQTSVKVIAEGHGALTERFDRFEIRFDRLEARFDQLDIKVGVLDKKVGVLDKKVGILDKKVDALADTSSDTQWRLERIEGHLELNGACQPRRVTATKSASTRRRKKP